MPQKNPISDLQSLATHTLTPLIHQHGVLSRQLNLVQSNIHNTILRFLKNHFPDGNPPLSTWVGHLPRYHYDTQWGLSSSLKIALLSPEFVSAHPHLSFSSILSQQQAAQLLSPHLLDDAHAALPTGWFLLYSGTHSTQTAPNAAYADILLLKIA